MKRGAGKGPVVTLALGDAPGAIRESIRAVLSAHGFVVANPTRIETESSLRFDLVQLEPDHFERVLRELGNNVAQALFAIQIGDD